MKFQWNITKSYFLMHIYSLKFQWYSLIYWPNLLTIFHWYFGLISTGVLFQKYNVSDVILFNLEYQPWIGYRRTPDLARLLINRRQTLGLTLSITNRPGVWLFNHFQTLSIIFNHYQPFSIIFNHFQSYIPFSTISNYY